MKSIPTSIDLKNTNIDQYITDVQQNGMALEHVPEELRDEKMCLAAVQQNGWALQFVPEAVQLANSNICLASVQQNGWALQFVPEAVQLANSNICLASVQKDGWALQFVPESLKTNVEALAKLYKTSQEQLIIDLKLLKVENEIICKVLSHLAYNIARESVINNINSEVLGVLQKYIQPESKDKGVVYHPEPYLHDINQPGWTPTGSNMPEEVQRLLPEISKAAVQQNGRALKFVPEDLKDEKMCLAAVQQNGLALQLVPEYLKDEKMCLAAAQQDGWALQYVPEALRDEKMCLAAVQQTWQALRYVPEAVQLANSDICLASVQQYVWVALKFVPEAVQLTHPHICVTAVQQDGEALEFVPEAVQLAHPHICVAAVQQDGLALRYVPESLKTNVEALAKLYRTSEEALISDLRLLQINDDVIEEVICYLKAPIAISSSMIVDLLDTGNDSKQNDSKQPAENTVSSIDIIPGSGVLSLIREYVHSPSKQGNDEKEIKDFSLS